MKSSAPASRPRTQSSVPSSEVTITTGTPRIAGISRMRRQTSKPSMPGITTSSSTRSGACAATRASAASPLSACSTV